AASSSGGSMIGWLTNNPVGAAHVSTTGAVTPLDLAALDSPYVVAADVGAGPSGYLLALGIPVVVADPPAMRAALLSTTGAFSAKLDFDAMQASPSVTYDGQNYVVVWSDPNREPRELRAARFTPSLSLLDTPPKVLFEYPAEGASLTEITSNGSESLVTWTQSGGDSIRVTRVSRELEVLDPGGIAITDSASAARGISSVWDGERYWIVWHGSAPFAAPHVTVYGRRVSANAVPLDSTPFIVASDLLNLGVIPNRLVDVASSAEGGALVTYVQANTETFGNTVRGRILSSVGDQGGGGAGGTSGAAGGGVGGNPGIGGNAGGPGIGGNAGVGGVAGTGQGGAEAGAGGEGANAGTSGDAGSDQGGMSGSSGASGRGGSATGGAGEAGLGGEAGSGAASGASGASGNGNGDDDGDSGCSCSVPRAKPRFGAAWLYGIVIVWASRRRRRRSAR
ncbi:MAG TPA: MYXO-CTERM sorting domain-containing protein, partial [Polyangiaceae bacterium]|nr:MYXO-CTERM sorting domain-containing protein [Polyangiaceae bacterium]